MHYSLEYTTHAERALRNLDNSISKRILEKLESLRAQPRAPGAIKLTGQNAYRVRVGDYRIIYAIIDDKLLILVIDIGHRRDIYR